MAYGLEITTPDNYKVIDENNYVMVVAEKGTISGTRSLPFGSGGLTSINTDTSDEWVRIYEDIDPTSGVNNILTNYYATVELTNSYSEKPIIAVRGKNGTAMTLPSAYVYKHSSTNFNRIRFTDMGPKSVDYIIIAPANTASPTVPVGENYGMQILDGSSNVLFDSRWPELIALKDTATFPTFSNTNNYRTSGAPSGGSTTVSNGSYGDFYSLSSVYGNHQVKAWKEDIGEGNYLYHYGNYWRPSLTTQVDGAAVIPTMVRSILDPGLDETTTETSSGTVTSYTSTGGKWMAIQYRDF